MTTATRVRDSEQGGSPLHTHSERTIARIYVFDGESNRRDDPSCNRCEGPKWLARNVLTLSVS